MNTVESVGSNVSAEERELATRGIPGLFFKFALPGVVGLLFVGIQSIIDGIVLGRWIGPNALASVNLVLPCYSFMTAFAIVMGVGCQTLIGICLGRRDRQGANDAFTTAFLFLLGFSTLVGLLIFIFAGKIAFWLGANEVLQAGAVEYIRSIVPFFPVLTVMFLGDYVLKATGHPLYAMIVLSGTVLLNVVLNLCFVVLLKWGIMGAGLATGIAFTVGLILDYSLLVRKQSLLPLPSGHFRRRWVWKMFYNGSSEGMSELSAGITVYLFNITMMHYLGEQGVAAFTATNYVLFIGTTIFLGISDGCIPIMSYNFGAGRLDRVRAALGVAFRTNLVLGVLLFCMLFFGGKSIVSLFFRSGDSEVLRIAIVGTSIYAFAFLMNGLNILASSYFTAMGNAQISIIISLLRGLVFVGIGIVVFPVVFGIESIWFNVPVAEAFTLLVSLWLVRKSFRLGADKGKAVVPQPERIPVLGKEQLGKNKAVAR